MHSTIYTCFNKVSRDFEADKFAQSFDANIFSSPDFLGIKKTEGKKNISIEQVREVIGFVSIKPSYSPVKVVIFYDSQDLSIEAQNALLKTLEEPPEHVQIILCVDNLSNLLDTVVSRCKVVSVKSLEEIKSDHELQSIVELVSQNIGQRIDWVMSNRSDLSSKDYVVDLFDCWIREIQSEIESNSDSIDRDTLKIYMRSVNTLLKYKESIKRFNVSSLLCVESFLVNI